MTKDIVCIACPRGCRLTVSDNGNEGTVTVSGNSCAKGISYGQQELLCPMRILTTTVSCRCIQKQEDCASDCKEVLIRLPVKTGYEIPLADIISVIHKIHALTVESPVRHGDCIAHIHTAAGKAVPVIACASTED